MKRAAGTALLALALALGGCGPPEPVRIGFLGGLSGRVADLGESGRNGALFAVEEANAAGGIGGRPIEIVVRDDAQSPATAIAAIEALAAAGVTAVIGPMTSAMGEAILPAINRLGLVTVSPTITASTFSGQDDFLFKLAPSVEKNTRTSAAYLHALGARRLAIAYDLGNRAYTADWVAHYRRDFAAQGGAVVAEVSFTSGEDNGYARLVARCAEANPDSLMFVANAVDTVRLTQVARNLGLRLPVVASTWAATESFIELGGRAVEGVALTQFFDRQDRSPGYLAHAKAFRARFDQEPGFASVAAYDATRAVLAALARGGSGGPALKQALLAAEGHDGLQGRWRFDRHGDAQRAVHMTVVRHGRFELVD